MKKISLITILFFTHFLVAQQIPIGGWQEHLCYKSAISVAEGNGMVYCATTSGIFSYKKADNSMTRFSKVSGLSDVQAAVLNFNPYDNKLLIAYKNSNLDLIEGNLIVNISDIKRQPIIGNKAINNITFINQYAYLSCGFGIVVIDMDRDEVHDTYYIGPGGDPINVRDITTDGTLLYAATDAGIYKASLSNPFLANFSSWTLMSGLPTGIYNTITSFSGKIYTNYSKYIMTSGVAYGQDSMFVFDGTSWTHFIPAGFSPGGSGYITYSIKNNYNQLVLVLEGAVFTFDPSVTGTGYYSGYFSDITRAKAAVLDNSNNLWIADSKYGLVAYKPTGGGYSYQYPNGPGSENVLNMSFSDDQLWVAPGGYSRYFIDGLYEYKDEQWYNIKQNTASVHMDTVYDFMDVLVDPNNSKHVYASTWGQGILELYNGSPVKLDNSTNSSLSHLTGTYDPVWTYGLALDANSNLWVNNPGVNRSISSKTPGGVWNSLDFSTIIGTLQMEQLLIDKSDQKWATISNGGGGILVYKGGPTDHVSAANAKKLSMTPGNGGLPSNTVFCMAEDNDGEIWVGTDKGVAVFYSPENVFTGENFDSQQILLTQDGHVQILLLTENVQAIAVDDANRKWISTSNSGVFLMSADGTQQIEHFDQDNSPLFSNDVKSIAINHKTGEVYFGTSKGIISYRGTAAQAYDDFTDVYAFPNPVRHEYTGPIAIKGLTNNATLKITDISGRLVYETQAEGGQAIWYGKNFKDERVSTGVYIVFCTSEDGSKKMVTKILVIN